MIFKNYKEHLSIFLGFLICGFIFWNRFLRIRSPYFLDEIILTYLFIGINVLTFILIFISSIIEICKISIIKISFIDESSIVYKIMEYVKKSPENFFIFLYNKYSFRFIETPMSYIVVYFYNSKGILFITLLLLFPPLILSIIFFIEIIFYNYVFIFIKMLIILIIPLTLRICIYIAKMHSTTYLNHMRSYLEFFKYENEEEIYMRLKPEFENAIPKMSLRACEAYYEIYVNIKQFCETIEQQKNNMKPYFMLFYSSLFLTSWLYIIFTTL